MTRSVKAPVAAWLGCAAAFALLALVAYGVDAAQHADARLLTRFLSHDDDLAGTFARIVVVFGDPLPLLALTAAAVAVGLWRARPGDAVAAVVVVAGANLTTQLLKAALAHPRFQAILGDEQLGAVTFPSGHVTAATSIAIAFLYVSAPEWRPLVGLAGACLVAAVGAAVMVLGWHFPSDVAGGVLVACGWGFAVLAGQRALEGGDGRGRGGRVRQVPRRDAIAVK